MTIEKYKNRSTAVEALLMYRRRIQQELFERYMLVSQIILNQCLTSVKKDEKKALFYFMIGNIAHDTTKIVGEELVAEVKQHALDSYQSAMHCAKNLHFCNKIRLGIEYEQAKFYYDVLGDHAKASQLAERTVAQAIESMEEVDEETQKEVKIILERMNNRMNKWKEQMWQEHARKQQL